MSICAALLCILLAVVSGEEQVPVCTSALLHEGAAKIRYASLVTRDFTSQVSCKLPSPSKLDPTERAAASVVVLAGTHSTPFRKSLASHAPLGHKRTEAMLMTQFDELVAFPNSSLTCFTSRRCNASQLHDRLVSLVALSYVGWENDFDAAAEARRTFTHSINSVIVSLFDFLQKPMRIVDIPSILRFESLFYEKWTFPLSPRGKDAKLSLRVASYPPLLQSTTTLQPSSMPSLSSLSGDLTCPSEMVHVLLASQRAHLKARRVETSTVGLGSVVQEECITTPGLFANIVTVLFAPLLGAEVMSEWSEMSSECVVYRRAASAPLCLSLSTPSTGVIIEMRVELVVDWLFIEIVLMFVAVSVVKPVVVRHHSSAHVERATQAVRAMTHTIGAMVNTFVAFTGHALNIPVTAMIALCLCVLCIGMRTPLVAGLIALTALFGGLLFAFQSPSSATVCSRIGFVAQVWWLGLALFVNPDAFLCMVAVALLIPIGMLIAVVVYLCFSRGNTLEVISDADNDPEDDAVVLEKANQCNHGAVFLVERIPLGKGATKNKRMQEFKASGVAHTRAALDALAEKVRREPQRYVHLVSDPQSLLQFANDEGV